MSILRIRLGLGVGSALALCYVLSSGPPLKRLLARLRSWFGLWSKYGYRQLLFHFQAAELICCSSCRCLLLPEEKTSTCGRCERFQLCGACQHLGTQHGHDMYSEIMPLVTDTSPFVVTESTAEAVALSLRIYGPRPCLGCRPQTGEGNSRRREYIWMTYSEVEKIVYVLGVGIASLLDSPGCFVGILSAVSLPWFHADLACTLKGLPLVCMHRATSVQQLAHIFQETQVKVLIASKHLYGVVCQASLKASGVLPSHVIWIEDDPDAYAMQVEVRVPHVSNWPWQDHEWNDVIAIGQRANETTRWHVAQVSPQTVVKLLPSSGSTGLPKLVMVTEAGLSAGVDKKKLNSSVDIVLYAYEVIRQSHDVFMQGGRIGIFSGSLERMLEDVQCLRPTVLAGTPTFWNGLFSQFEEEVLRAGLQTGQGDCTQIRRQIIQHWHDMRPLGNRVCALISTGAPLRHEVQRWATRVFGKLLLNAYGCTETGGLTSNGAVANGVEVRLLDVPEMNYFTSDRPYPRGEILAKTPRMAGYFKRELMRPGGAMLAVGQDDSEEWITLSGIRYFRTGDVGELRGPGEVKVIDRCKNHFKLAQGIYVAPEPLEELFQQSPLVSDVFIWGNGHLQAVVAVVVPTIEVLNQLGLQYCEPISTCACQEHVRKAQHIILRSLHKLSQDNGLKIWETPNRVWIETKPFSEMEGFLGASNKLCRPALIRHYRERLSDCGEEFGEPLATTASACNIGLCSGLQEVLSEVSDMRHFSAKDSLMVLGLDSMRIARLSARLSERFGVEISPRLLFSLRTLDDLERVIFGGMHAAKKAIARADVVDWEAEAKEAFSSIKTSRQEVALDSQTSLPSGRSAILVTGATGFLGCFVLASLCKTHLGKIVCLVRADSQHQAEQRLLSTMREYGLLTGENSDRVIILATAGLEVDGLGLSVDDWESLSRSVTCIVHCAAQVSGALPYAALRRPNVVGTCRVLELAIRASAKLVHVSTLGFTPSGQGESLEVHPSCLPVRSGYAQSKWVAERVVCFAMEEFSLRAVVIRPGAISGDSQSGSSNKNDAVSLLLCGLIKAGIVSTDSRSPIGDWYNLVPVDSVANAIGRIAACGDITPNVFHICAARSISLKTLCIWIRKAGYILEDVSAEVFCNYVRKVKDYHPLFPLRAQLAQLCDGKRESSKYPKDPCMHNISALVPKAPLQEMSSDSLQKSLAYLMTKLETPNDSLDSFRA